MKRFHANEKPDVKFIEVRKRVETCQAAQIDEDFNVGTNHGIATGRKGDYLLMEGSSLSVVREEDFDTIYEKLSKSKTSKVADVNKDGTVDEKDLSIVHKAYAKEKKAEPTRLILTNLPKEKKKEDKVEKKVAKKSSKEIYQPKPAKVVAKKAPKKVVKKVVKKTKKKK